MYRPLSPIWTVLPPNSLQSAQLARKLGVSPFVAQLLLNRGVADADTAAQFLHASLEALHNPFDLTDMDRGVDRLLTAIHRQEAIVVYGDYDVDGTTSAALLFDFFRSIGVQIDIYIPDRLKEGYSLNKGALDRLKAQGTRVLVTVDNGISSLECARYAAELGIDLIITDHHEVMAELPVAVAVINPKRSDNRADFAGVAGVGVAFYLAMALRKRLRDSGFFAPPRREPSLVALLDLVALGTVADVAPLTGQNRILVRRGLEMIRKTVRPGIRALCEVSQIVPEKVDAGAIGFRLGPRINAGGRIGEPKDGFYLLTALTVEDARPFAMRLHAENERRRKIEEHILQEAQALFESQEGFTTRMACMVAGRDWNPGVIGIVASRLVERYQRPAIVFAWDGKVWKGSARSISGFPIHTAIGECREHVLQFGGHPQAAGLSLREESLQAFYTAFERISGRDLTPDRCRKRLKIDMVAQEPMTERHIEEMALLDPVGYGNPAPLLMYEGIEVVRVNRLSEGKHLKLQVVHGKTRMDALAFRYPTDLYDPILATEKHVSLVFRAEINTWQDRRSVQLHILDLRAPKSSLSP